MRWQGQKLGVDDTAALPGMERMDGLVRSVTTPEFAGMTFHEVLAKTALNRVPGASAMPFDWTVNPYRGCSHSCAYCLSPETLIMMADGGHKPLAEVKVGDEIVGRVDRHDAGRREGRRLVDPGKAGMGMRRTENMQPQGAILRLVVDEMPLPCEKPLVFKTLDGLSRAEAQIGGQNVHRYSFEVAN